MSVLGTLCTRQCLRLGNGLQIQQLRSVPAKWLTTTSCLKAVEPLDQNEDYWVKNKRLNRPTSPHLTIYKFQLTSMLSITHRGTGLAMSGLMSGFAITMLALPHGFPHYYQLMTSCSGGLTGIFAIKFLLAWHSSSISLMEFVIWHGIWGKVSKLRNCTLQATPFLVFHCSLVWPLQRCKNYL